MLTAVDTFFDTAAFAEPATYTPSGGVATVIKVIFDMPYAVTEVPGVEGVAVQSTQPVAICRTVDVPTAGKGATIVIRNVTYYVMEPQPDGTGVTRLVLSADPVV